MPSRLVGAALLVAGTLFAGLLPAQEAARSPGFTRGWYVVRPGDTLHSIAGNYLGDRTQWRQLAELNPDLENPNRLTPGKPIRIRLDSKVAIPAAQISKISGRVESRPTPVPWNQAIREELLKNKDGTRTFGRSSAEMIFQDGTNMVLTEDSLVFFRTEDLVGAPQEAVRSQQVEIVEGQADLASVEAVFNVDVEVFVGGARALPEADATGKVSTRARQAKGGGAAFMVFEGSSDVEASGEKVAVATGMGTVVPESGPPAEPEKLLPKPVTLRPLAGTEANFSNPVFEWQEVAGARDYTIELCLDPRCSELVRRFQQLSGSRWLSTPLPVGDFYWRLSAVASSGLDGYSSDPLKLKILSDAPDQQVPAASVRVLGPQFRVGEELFVDENVSFSAQFDDSQSGVSESQLAVGTQVIADPAKPGELAEGPHRLTADTGDWAGNRYQIDPIPFTVDTRPPEIHWQVTDRSIVDQVGDPVVDTRHVGLRHQRWQKEELSWLEWSDSGRHWIPLGWGTDNESRVWQSLTRKRVASVGNGIYNEWHIPADTAQLLLISPGDSPFVGPDAPQLLADQLLWISVEDEGCGVDNVTLRTRDSADGGYELEIEAVDFFGHSTTISWPLEAQTKRERKVNAKALAKGQRGALANP